VEIIEQVTMKDVRESGAKMIFYAARTCWWTHDPTHLSRLPPATEGEIKRTAENFRLNSGRLNSPIDEFMERARRTHEHRLPCDPRGSVLFQTDDVHGFLNKAAENPEHYGPHGLRAFMAAHHSNCVLSLADPRAWSDESWDAYNAALDRLDERKAEATKERPPDERR
jgi:hypothetical protein